MNLDDLILELQKHPRSLVVPAGFGGQGHSDRGDYSNLAFEPRERVTVGEMLDCARGRMGTLIIGYKGGSFLVQGSTEVYIGEDSSQCGEPVTPLLLRYMIGCAKHGIFI